MQTWEEKVMERERGREEGRQEGKLEGEQRLSQLIQFLIKEEKDADIQKVLTDQKYRERLYMEYHI